MKMKLYYAPNTCALACWICLEWAGAEYEAVRADYSSEEDRKSTRLNSSHTTISYAVFCLKKKK